MRSTVGGRGLERDRGSCWWDEFTSDTFRFREIREILMEWQNERMPFFRLRGVGTNCWCSLK